MNFRFFLGRLRQISVGRSTPCCRTLQTGTKSPNLCLAPGLALLVTLLYIALTVAACRRDKEPFTADQRFFVDSVSGLRIRQAQAEIDSLCTLKETTEVPRLADSLYRVRKAQMEEKLREFKSGI